MSARRATHAGSWYTDSATDLARQLEGWLGQADLSHGPARAIIAPHAGYQYSGSVGAYAYRQVSPVVVKRVFILGPSHHVRLSGCALSSLPKYRTPLYDLIVDQQVYSELYQTGHFETMSVSADEDEHSIEMHLPYVAKVMEDFRDHFTIVPILVGSLTPEREILYGRLLAPYLADPQSLFVISSDFCHWGQRFRYTYYDRSVGEIWQSIQKLDKQGMNLIETLNPSAFTEYLKKYGNTICGRHPIGVLLNAVATLQKTSNGHRMLLKFLQYAQSSRCYTSSDSSVSYAAASLIFE
ncbi:protein MEMO1 [Panulirus ornatus]|uniref:protein MEMO1 n=1 Tax=Panulirus ornatus TaxID=150431 RepID=UPI003A894D0D